MPGNDSYVWHQYCCYNSLASRYISMSRWLPSRPYRPYHLYWQFQILVDIIGLISYRIVHNLIQNYQHIGKCRYLKPWSKCQNNPDIANMTEMEWPIISNIGDSNTKNLRLIPVWRSQTLIKCMFVEELKDPCPWWHVIVNARLLLNSYDTIGLIMLMNDYKKWHEIIRISCHLLANIISKNTWAHVLRL